MSRALIKLSLKSLNSNHNDTIKKDEWQTCFSCTILIATYTINIVLECFHKFTELYFNLYSKWMNNWYLIISVFIVWAQISHLDFSNKHFPFYVSSHSFNVSSLIESVGSEKKHSCLLIVYNWLLKAAFLPMITLQCSKLFPIEMIVFVKWLENNWNINGLKRYCNNFPLLFHHDKGVTRLFCIYKNQHIALWYWCMSMPVRSCPPGHTTLHKSL